jgi:hypothetical protein
MQDIIETNLSCFGNELSKAEDSCYAWEALGKRAANDSEVLNVLKAIELNPKDD